MRAVRHPGGQGTHEGPCRQRELTTVRGTRVKWGLNREVGTQNSHAKPMQACRASCR